MARLLMTRAKNWCRSERISPPHRRPHEQRDRSVKRGKQHVNNTHHTLGTFTDPKEKKRWWGFAQTVLCNSLFCSRQKRLETRGDIRKRSVLFLTQDPTTERTNESISASIRGEGEKEDVSWASAVFFPSCLVCNQKVSVFLKQKDRRDVSIFF